eukprot:gene3568-4445_t
MISIAPTPLYLPSEEANKVHRSPIFQRKEGGKKNQQPSSSTKPTTTPSNTTKQQLKNEIHTTQIKRSAYQHFGSLDKNQLNLIKKTSEGLAVNAPKLSQDGVGGGTYFIKDSHHHNQSIAVFKPKDEENGIMINQTTVTGIKNGCFPGEGPFKEVAVYLFSKIHQGFFGVPTTTLVEMHHPIWRHPGQHQNQLVKKIGSLQEYIAYEDTAEEVGCSNFTVDNIHRIGLLDCLIFNCDRHSGNMLAVIKEDDDSENDRLELVPIDHSLCLPSYDTLSDAWFDWINFPQSKLPFSGEMKRFIESIDIDSDIELIHKSLPKLRIESLLTLKFTTMFVKSAVLKANLNLSQIGSLMSRFHYLDQPSTFESIIGKVLKSSAPISTKSLTSKNHQFWSNLQQEIDLYFQED